MEFVDPIAVGELEKRRGYGRIMRTYISEMYLLKGRCNGKQS